MKAFLVLFRLRLFDVLRSRASTGFVLFFPLMLLGVLGLVFMHGHPFERRYVAIVETNSGGDVIEQCARKLDGFDEVRVGKERTEAEALGKLRARMASAVLIADADGSLDDKSGGIVDCNDEAIRMLRCSSKQEVMTIHPAVLSPEFQPDGRRSLEKCIEMDNIAWINGDHRFEWIHRRKNGEDFPVEVTLTPVELHTGPAILVVWHELTHIKRAESELKSTIAIIQEQARQIQALSTAILEVWDRVLLVPLLGVLDAERADQLSNSLLHAITARQATYVIVDSTGIATMDQETARRVIGIIDAVRLLGAQGVVVGIRREVALSLVETGVDIGRIRTLPNVRAALSVYLRQRR